MNKTLIMVVAVVVIVLGGYLAWSYMNQSAYQGTGDNTPKPTPIIQPTPTPEASVATSTAPQAKTWRIDYTVGAFTPKVVTIKKGDTVTWVNTAADADAWLASAMHPTHDVYPQNTGACAKIGGSDFDACKGLKPGESWSFKFDFVGSWKYHDHLHPSVTGTVIVTD